MAPSPMRETSSPPIEMCFMTMCSVSSNDFGRAFLLAGVERQRRRELAVRVDLGLKIGHLLLGGAYGIGARDEAARPLLLVRDRDQRLGELRRVAALPAVLGFPKLLLRRSALRIILDRRLSVLRRLR